MAMFHALKVVEVKRETRDAVIVSLQPAEGDTYLSFIQGQYLTFRKKFGGEEIRRSYSICSKVGDPILQVGIKKVQGGLFSSWANEELKAGDILEAMKPMGNFYSPLNSDHKKNYLGFAAGSGITPFISIIKTTLDTEPNSSFTLVYGNKSSNTIMFREELDDLKNIYLGRISILHILGRENQDIDLFNGRIDMEKCDLLFKNWINIDDADMALICGPEPMMLTIATSLKKHGMDEKKIKFELFSSNKPTKVNGKSRADTNNGGDVEQDTIDATIIIDGLSRNIQMIKNNDSILDAGLAQGLELPYACKGGVCSTCKAKVIEGDVDMEANFSLEDYEVAAGYVLTCQCYPISEKIIIDYDQ